MRKTIHFLLYSFILSGIPSWSQSKTTMQYPIPKMSPQDRCHSTLELSTIEAQEKGKYILAFIYPSQDLIIENFLTGAAESMLKKLSNDFIFYTLEMQSGLLPFCSEKSFILEKLQITRLPTILVLDPTTSKICEKIERPTRGALTEELLMKNMEELLKKKFVS